MKINNRKGVGLSIATIVVLVIGVLVVGFSFYLVAQSGKIADDIKSAYCSNNPEVDFDGDWLTGMEDYCPCDPHGIPGSELYYIKGTTCKAIPQKDTEASKDDEEVYHYVVKLDYPERQGKDCYKWLREEWNKLKDKYPACELTTLDSKYKSDSLIEDDKNNLTLSFKKTTQCEDDLLLKAKDKTSGKLELSYTCGTLLSVCKQRMYDSGICD